MRLLRSGGPSGRQGRDLPPARKRGGAKRRAPAGRWTLPRSARLAAIAFLCVGILAGAGTWSVRAGHLALAAAWLGDLSTRTQLAAGLRVEAVFVEGRSETDAGQIVRALEVAIGDPILALDAHTARQRLETLGWVKTARIERRLPNTLIVRLEERQAIAIWQRGGAFDLIDAEGAVIGADGLARHSHLLVVVGEGAERAAAGLIEALERAPALRERVEAAVRMGERRWNLRFKGGVDVRLPETGVEEAVARLAELDMQHDLLARDIVLIDMREPDRMVLRQSPEAAERGRAGPGDRT